MRSTCDHLRRVQAESVQASLKIAGSRQPVHYASPTASIGIPLAFARGISIIRRRRVADRDRRANSRNRVSSVEVQSYGTSALARWEIPHSASMLARYISLASRGSKRQGATDTRETPSEYLSLRHVTPNTEIPIYGLRPRKRALVRTAERNRNRARARFAPTSAFVAAATRLYVLKIGVCEYWCSEFGQLGEPQLSYFCMCERFNVQCIWLNISRTNIVRLSREIVIKF